MVKKKVKEFIFLIMGINLMENGKIINLIIEEILNLIILFIKHIGIVEKLLNILLLIKMMIIIIMKILILIL